MKICAIDFETHLISPEAPVPPPVCLSFFNGKDSGLVATHELMEQSLKAILKDELIIAHNFTFEANVIYYHFPTLRPDLLQAIDEGRIYCSKIYEKLLDNIRKKQLYNHSLANLVLQYFEEDISEVKSEDSWRYRYSELDGVPLEAWPQEAKDYAIEDSIWAYKIYEVQKERKLNFVPTVQAEILLNLMSQKGILVDKDRVLQLEAEILEKITPMYDLLKAREFMSEKNQKRTKVFREHLLANYKELNKTPKGAISISDVDLAKYLEERDDEIVRAFLYIAKYEKVLSAFVSNLKQANPCIRSEYNGAVSSGRTSSKKSSLYPSVNIQQMPREVPDVTWDVRNCFIPRPGFKICSIDYSGLELSSTAHQLKSFYKTSAMGKILNSGNSPVDMHSKFACVLKSMAERRNISYEEFVANKKKPGYKEFRQLAKPINLGFPGGIGYDTMRMLLAKDGVFPKLEVIHVGEDENEILKLIWRYSSQYNNLRCKRISKFEYALVADELVGIKEALFSIYPELQKFLKKGHENFLTGEVCYLKNDYGEYEAEEMYRYSTTGLERDYCTYTALCNGFLMQSPSAAGAKKATAEVIKKYLDHPDVNPLAFIHDEIVFEVREGSKMYDYITDIGEIMIREMQSVLSSVRITVEAELMDYWMKSGGTWSMTMWKDFDKDEVRYK